MFGAGRVVETYCALSEAAARWPGWRFEASDLKGMSEVICADEQLVLIDPKAWPEGEAFAWAHVLAHLDWGHHLEPGGLTAEQESVADWAAGLRTGGM